MRGNYQKGKGLSPRGWHEKSTPVRNECGCGYQCK